MSQLFISATGRALDVGDRIAAKLDELAKADLVEELVEALGAQHPALAPFGALLSSEQLEELRAFLQRAADTLEPSELVRQLSRGIETIPQEGINWAWKPDSAELSAEPGRLLSGSGRASMPARAFSPALDTSSGAVSASPAASNCRSRSPHSAFPVTSLSKRSSRRRSRTTMAPRLRKRWRAIYLSSRI